MNDRIEMSFQTVTEEETIQCVLKVFKQLSQDDTLTQLTREECVVHMLLSVGKGHIQAESFVRKINRWVLAAHGGCGIKLLQRALGVLLHRKTEEIMDPRMLGQLKVVTFTNLACVLKQQHKFSLALKAATKALAIEQTLLQQYPQDHKYQIVTTHLNKAAVLSEMGRHPQALKHIFKVHRHLIGIEDELQLQLASNPDETHTAHLLRKRHYGSYMMMLVCYNLGAEHQHLKQISAAFDYYKQSRLHAQLINNVSMTQKLDYVLQQLSKHTTRSRDGVKTQLPLQYGAMTKNKFYLPLHLKDTVLQKLSSK